MRLLQVKTKPETESQVAFLNLNATFASLLSLHLSRIGSNSNRGLMYKQQDDGIDGVSACPTLKAP